jgi:hypothetical protein
MFYQFCNLGSVHLGFVIFDGVNFQLDLIPFFTRNIFVGID